MDDQVFVDMTRPLARFFRRSRIGRVILGYLMARDLGQRSLPLRLYWMLAKRRMG